MKGLFYFTSLLILFLSACTVRNIPNSHRDFYFHQLSAEVEHSSNVNKNNILAGKQTIPAFNTINNTSSEKISIPVRNIEVLKKESVKISISDYQEGNTYSLKRKNSFIQEEKKIYQQKSLRVDKNNIFWKIGKVLITAGLVFLSVFGGIFVSVNNGGAGAFFSSGLFIGLAILALSVPFFLLALITSYMKEKSKPIENPNEI